MSAPRPTVCFTNGAESRPHMVGIAVGEYREPTVLLVLPNGREAAWAKSLTREPTHQEEVEYWRERAIAAEESRDKALALLDRSQAQTIRALDMIDERIGRATQP